jgi:hypothetical protein
MGREKWTKGTEQEGAKPAKNGKAKKKSQHGATKMADLMDKHECYHKSVQEPKAEITSLLNFYRNINSSRGIKKTKENKIINDNTDYSDALKEPTVLREDFCGTAILCKEWVSRGALKVAYGIDIDASVIEYSRKHIIPSSVACERIDLYTGNVLTFDHSKNSVETADIIAALNYGIFYFKQRRQLVQYFINCKKGLASNGILVCDMFGGAQCYEAKKMSIRHFPDFTYYFEQRSFDILTNTAKCYLHFQFKDNSWIKNAYSYDFRVYTPLEVRDCMEEAGFTDIHFWWTETFDQENGSKDQDGNEVSAENEGLYFYEKIDMNKPLEGKFAWNAYIVAHNSI